MDGVDQLKVDVFNTARFEPTLAKLSVQPPNIIIDPSWAINYTNFFFLKKIT